MVFSLLDTIEINPKEQPLLSVIWLHGLGADGHDFEGVVPHLNIPSHCPIRFIFPHAPYRQVTVNMGMRMRAWYDIINPVLGLPGEDRVGIEESSTQISELIARENANGIDTSQIVLAGFSQGGAIALHLGLRYPERFAGILALSTYLSLAESIDKEISQTNLETSILYLHGTLDPVVPITTAEKSRDKLRALGCKLKTRDYPIPHAVSPEEILDIGAWLTARCEAVNRLSESKFTIDEQRA